MKVTSSPAMPLILLLVACSYASPLFGTGGMMKRKFPGASEMSYRTYREIANSNAAATASGVAARTGGAAVAPRIGGSSSGDTAWMFGSELASPSLTPSNQPGSSTQAGLSYNRQQPSFYQQQSSFNQQKPSSNQQQESTNQQGLSFAPKDSHDTFSAAWYPHDTYAFLQFPYDAPTYLDYDDVFVPQKKIYRKYY